MKKLYSQLIGLPLVVRGTGDRLGRVFDLSFDPDRGTLLGVHTTHAQVITPVDLGEVTDHRWNVRSVDAPIDEQDLVRLSSIPKSRRKLMGKKVRTRSGEELGLVGDLMIEMTTLSLIQLYVVKRWGWFWVTNEQLLEWHNIVEITEEAIIVKDRHIKGEAELEHYWQLRGKMPVPASSA